MLIQTRYPEDIVFRALKRQSYPLFAEHMLRERKADASVPYVYQAILGASAETLSEAIDFLQDAQTIEDFYKILCDNKLNLVLDGLSVAMNTDDPDDASQEKSSYAVLSGKGSMDVALDDIDKSQGDFEFKLNKMPDDALLSMVFEPFFVTKDNAFYSKIVLSEGKMTVNGKRF